MVWETANPATLTAVSVTAAVCTASVLGTLAYERWLRRKDDYVKNNGILRPAGRIAHIMIYPIKSCRGIEVDWAECTIYGPKYGIIRDRSFLIVDGNGHSITGGFNSKLVLITPSFHGNMLRLDAPDMETVRIDLDQVVRDKKVRRCTKYLKYEADAIDGYDCGPEVGQWLQKFLDVPGAGLLFFDETNMTPFYGRNRADGGGRQLRETDKSFYTNMSSYMLLSSASVDDLNERIENPVSFLNFRPNILVDGSKPFEEETWLDIRIGDVAMKNVRYCVRCPFVNVNVKNGVREVEPLKVLRKYHKTDDAEMLRVYKGNTPVMGVHLGIDRIGVIKVGDTIYVSQKE